MIIRRIINQADRFDFGAYFDGGRWAFDFQIFDHRDRVAIGKHIADCIFDGWQIVAWLALLPFVATHGAKQQITVCIGEFFVAVWAGWQGHLSSTGKLQMKT